jgi:protein TonB
LEAARQTLASEPLPELSRDPIAHKTPPQTVKQILPQYSQRARWDGIQGHVVVTLLLKEDGTPTYIFVARSLDLDLDKNAIDAVRKWQFTPAQIDGHPIPAWINVDVDFHLYHEVR